MLDTDSLAEKARTRALRAARAVTLGLALATGGAGCFTSHRDARRAPEPDPDPDPMPELDPDGGIDEPPGDAGAVADAGHARDAGHPFDAGHDAGLARDAGSDAAALCDSTGDWMEYQACCDAHGWDFEWGCFAWGPFVPPSEVA